MGIIIFLLLVLGIAYRATSPEERLRLLRVVVGSIREASTRVFPSCEPFTNALNARMPHVFVTPALAALNAAVFLLMLFGAGAFGDPNTLVAWGGSVGPRTTNGEWWRLLTSEFVHSGTLHLLVNVAVLVQIGLVLERLVGRTTFAAAYLVSGIFASLVNLSVHPMTVSVGASGAIFGLYGLLLASSVWGLIERSALAVPLMSVTRLGPAAAIFVLYNVANGALGSAAELAGFLAGAVGGLVLARNLGERKPPAAHIAAVFATAVVLAVACAVPLRGIVDARPEIARLVTIEDRTARAYQAAADRFKRGRMTAEALAQMIDRTIMPELQAADVRLKALGRVPREHRPLVEGAEEYLRLRCESWRLRAEGLRGTDMSVRQTARNEQASDAGGRLRAEAQHKTNMLTLGKAEGTERASLEALERIRVR